MTAVSNILKIRDSNRISRPRILYAHISYFTVPISWKLKIRLNDIFSKQSPNGLQLVDILTAITQRLVDKTQNEFEKIENKFPRKASFASLYFLEDIRHTLHTKVRCSTMTASYPKMIHWFFSTYYRHYANRIVRDEGKAAAIRWRVILTHLPRGLQRFNPSCFKSVRRAILGYNLPRSIYLLLVKRITSSVQYNNASIVAYI